MKRTIAERLAHYSVRDENGCLIWQRSANSRGYGLIAIGQGRIGLAHRVAYEVAVGPIPDGHQVDHVWDLGCRSKLCIEPAHLEAVTAKVNMERTAQARKTHCLRGHPLSGRNLRVNGRGHRSCFECRQVVHRRVAQASGVLSAT